MGDKLRSDIEALIQRSSSARSSPQLLRSSSALSRDSRTSSFRQGASRDLLRLPSMGRTSAAGSRLSMNGSQGGAAFTSPSFRQRSAVSVPVSPLADWTPSKRSAVAEDVAALLETVGKTASRRLTSSPHSDISLAPGRQSTGGQSGRFQVYRSSLSRSPSLAGQRSTRALSVSPSQRTLGASVHRSPISPVSPTRPSTSLSPDRLRAVSMGRPAGILRSPSMYSTRTGVSDAVSTRSRTGTLQRSATVRLGSSVSGRFGAGQSLKDQPVEVIAYLSDPLLHSAEALRSRAQSAASAAGDAVASAVRSVAKKLQEWPSLEDSVRERFHMDLDADLDQIWLKAHPTLPPKVAEVVSKGTDTDTPIPTAPTSDTSAAPATSSPQSVPTLATQHPAAPSTHHSLAPGTTPLPPLPTAQLPAQPPVQLPVQQLPAQLQGVMPMQTQGTLHSVPGSVHSALMGTAAHAGSMHAGSMQHGYQQHQHSTSAQTHMSAVSVTYGQGGGMPYSVAPVQPGSGVYGAPGSLHAQQAAMAQASASSLPAFGNPSQGSSHTISHPHISVPSQANTGQGTNPLAALWTNFTSSPAYSPYNRHTCSPPRQTARARSGTSAAAASAHAATAAAAALRVPRVRVVDPSASQRSNTTPHHTYLTTNGHQLTHPPNPLQYTHGGVAGGVAGMGMAGADMLSFDGPYGNVPGTYVFYNSGSGSGGGSGGHAGSIGSTWGTLQGDVGGVDTGRVGAGAHSTHSTLRVAPGTGHSTHSTLRGQAAMLMSGGAGSLTVGSTVPVYSDTLFFSSEVPVTVSISRGNSPR